MSNEYQKNKQLYHHKYKEILPESKYIGKCFYCGDFKDELDHFPPLSKAQNYTNSSVTFLLIPSCHHCNLMLYNSMQGSVQERVKYVKDKLMETISGKTNFSEKEIRDWMKDNPKSRLLLSVISYNEQLKWLLSRYKFEGYNYELEGVINKDIDVDHEAVIVYGIYYKSLDTAITYLSRSRGIPYYKLTILCQSMSIEDAIVHLTNNKFVDNSLQLIARQDKVTMKEMMTIIESIMTSQNKTLFEAVSSIMSGRHRIV